MSLFKTIMKNGWYTNWLVVITVCLFLTSLGLFLISLSENIGIKRCAFGEVVFEDGRACICNSKGRVICDDDKVSTAKSEEFTTKDLFFTFNFLSYVEKPDNLSQGVKFLDITHVGDTLKIRVEKNVLCSTDSAVSPQAGFYKVDSDRLILTSTSNLVSDTYSRPCISELVYSIYNMSIQFPDDYLVFYQDELDVLIPSGNCVYEGFLRNNGDVYKSSDGCFLCSCKQGQNICEKEPKCL
jgi:hypothetical protein